MKTTILPERFTTRKGQIIMAICCLAFLLVDLTSANAVFTPTGPTYLNVYFNDGTGSTISPTLSPYPAETDGSSSHVGTPLTAAGETWLTTGGSYPGAVSANWPVIPPSTWTSSGVTADVSYQQGSYWSGSNTAPASGVSPYGTSLSLVNPNGTTAELRLDWATTYTYSGPSYFTWSSGGAVSSGTAMTDANHNLLICTHGGNSGSAPPPWFSLHATAGGTYSDGTVSWKVFNSYAPGLINVTISGTVDQFSAVAGEESFALNNATIAPNNTARIQVGGDFSSGVPPTLSTYVDSTMPGYLFGFAPPPAGKSFFGQATAVVPTPQLMWDGDEMTDSGYLDVFVDPGSIKVQIASPVTLGITTYSNSPLVFFPTPAGTNYVLQVTTSLATGNWITVTDGIPFTGIEVTNAPNPAFFRLY